MAADHSYSPLETGLFCPVTVCDCARVTLVFYRKRAFMTDGGGQGVGRALSIKPLEKSHSRVRRTRGAREFNRFLPRKALPDGDFGHNVVIDPRRRRNFSHTTSASSYLRHHPFFKFPTVVSIHASASAARVASFLTGKTEAVRPNEEIGDEQNVGPLGPTEGSDHRQRSVGPVD